MRRVSPKLLVIVAAVLTLALLAYVFTGGDSTRTDRPPSDRLTDRQAGITPPPPVQQPVDPLITAATDAPPPAPPPPEPEVEPGPVTQQAPIVRPPPPAQPSRTAEAEARERARAQAKARQLAETRAEARRQAERRKAVAAAAARRRPSAPTPTRTAKAPSPAPVATARPSYNCRYARTRTEIAVCGDAGLASLDRQMATQFNTAVRQATPAQREVLERSRLRFLYRRDRCQTASCIAAAYQARMSEINDIAARHWREP